MITVVYSTHKDVEYNTKFKQHILDTVGLSDIQILEYVNHNQYSLSQVYNSGITESIFDIVVCCHNDIKLEKNWGIKLLSDFSNNPDFGIIGKAGSCYFPKSGVYWERMFQTMVGQVYHHPENGKKFLSKYSPKLPFLIPVVTIDGLFISFDKTKILHKFDETIGKFHYYDHLFCVPNYLDNVKIGVTSSFEITHQSIGQPNQEFFYSKELFLKKWKHVLPLDLKPKNIFIPEIKYKKNKKNNKVAIIIPTKGKIDLLTNCIISIFENCDEELFHIFIADTGSSTFEKDIIKENILPLGKIKLIEYDYYNFAKINNDVVQNYIDDSFDYLLFCNNDIKFMNDVIGGMLNIFNSNHSVGTVGARLHFEDNTIQHDGVFIGVQKTSNSIQVGHHNLKNYYNYRLGTVENFGNTGGLLMIHKKTFLKCDKFNEDYISCFEDVELNIKTIISGLKNYTCSDCVAYHYESQTRNEDPQNMEKLKYDYLNNLLPLIKVNIDKLKNKLILI